MSDRGEVELWDEKDDCYKYVYLTGEEYDFCSCGSDLAYSSGGSHDEAWDAFCARLWPILVRKERDVAEFHDSEEWRSYVAASEDAFRLACERERSINEAPPVPEVPFPRGSVLSRIWLQAYIAAEGIL